MNMTLESLLELLDLESPSQFEYFEHLAELMELTTPIPYDLFHIVLSEAPAPTLAELTDNYFEDILQGIPDNTIDIYTLLTAIRQNLFSLAQNSGNSDVRRQFADQLFQFKNWYTQEGLVHCTHLKDGAILDVSLCEAFALCRLEKLNEDQYDYDFSQCLDYDLPEYTVSLGEPEFVDGSEAQWEEDEMDGIVHARHSHTNRHVHHNCDCGCEEALDGTEDPEDDDAAGSNDPYGDGLIDLEHPVMDDEFQDDEPSPEEEAFLKER